MHVAGHLLDRVVHTTAGVHYRAGYIRRVLRHPATLHEHPAQGL